MYTISCEPFISTLRHYNGSVSKIAIAISRVNLFSHLSPLSIISEYIKYIHCRRRQLLSIEEAWNLPISAEMSSRQQQQQPQQGGRSSGQPFQKGYGQNGAPQGPPPPYPAPSPSTGKRFKIEQDQKGSSNSNQPNFMLTQQQINLLTHLQANAATLTQPQQNLMRQLQQQHNLMQQHLRNQANQGQTRPLVPPVAGPRGPASPFGNAMQLGAALNTKNFASSTNLNVTSSFLHGQQHDLDVEAELKDLLSQKDLATTLAENLLKHFGSDEMEEVKEEPDSTSTAAASRTSSIPVGKKSRKKLAKWQLYAYARNLFARSSCSS